MQYQSIFTSDYFSYYNSILNQNLCTSSTITTYKQPNFKADCTTINNGIAQYGLEIIITGYFELLRSVNSQYIINVPNDTTINLLNGSMLQRLSSIFHYFIKPLSSDLTQKMKENIDIILAGELNFRMAIFIAFLVFLILGYLILWMPYQNKLYDEILRTKKMLEIIPIAILENMDSLKEL